MDADTSVAQLFAESYRPLVLVTASESCVAQHMAAHRRWAQFLGRSPVLADFSDHDLTRLLSWLVSRQRAVATTNSVLRKLLALWRHAARMGLVDQWPTVRLLPEPDRLPEAWTAADLSAIMAACDRQSRTLDGVPAGPYWRAWQLVQWDSGERTGAMLKLPWSTVDLRGGWVVFRAEIRKGKRRDMLVRLKPGTVDALSLIVRPRRALVFPWSRDTGTWYRRYERLLKDSGLPWGRRCKPQKMRRSFASHLEAAGGNATAALGHSSRRITERSYLDPRVRTQQHPGDLLFRLDSPDVPPKLA